MQSIAKVLGKAVPAIFLLLAGPAQAISATSIASSGMPCIAYGEVAFTVNVTDVNGLPYSGEVDFLVFQDARGTFSTWAPIRVTVSSGLATFSKKLNSFDPAEVGVLRACKVNANGESAIAAEFFNDALGGVRGQSNFFLSTQNAAGEFPVSIPSLAMQPAPQLGIIAVSGPIAGEPFTATLSNYLDYSEGTNITNFTGSVGNPLAVYGWGSSSFPEFFVTTTSGWGVGKQKLLAGSNSVNLEFEGAVRLQYDPFTYSDAYFTLLFPQASHSEFVTPVGWSSSDAQASALLRRYETREGYLQPSAGEGLFSRVPAGNYVIELWTVSGLFSSDPKPTHTANVTVIGGVETLVSDFPVGIPFCDPADLNSTGLPAEISANFGSGVGSGLHLEATQGVPGEFGYFLIGTGVTDPGLPISDGHLCLAISGVDAYGRYNVIGGDLDSIGQFDTSGILQNNSNTSTTGSGYDVPLDIPIPGYVMILSGETWNFQLWYRDDNTGISNFSNGLTVQFP
ncbi:MAG: hypothetical protein H6827_08755 [Planctomycetes bacterium]|nr:hypothetical protein [Planctomycetota bacterium]